MNKSRNFACVHIIIFVNTLLLRFNHCVSVFKKKSHTKFRVFHSLHLKFSGKRGLAFSTLLILWHFSIYRLRLKTLRYTMADLYSLKIFTTTLTLTCLRVYLCTLTKTMKCLWPSSKMKMNVSANRIAFYTTHTHARTHTIYSSTLND